jgi:hypothetical protein
MTCDLFMPSSRIRALRSVSMRSCAAKGTAAEKSTATASIGVLIIEAMSYRIISNG